MIAAFELIAIALLIGSGCLFTISVGAWISKESIAGWGLYLLGLLFLVLGYISLYDQDVERDKDVEITEYRVDATKVINNSDTTYVYTLNFERK